MYHHRAVAFCLRKIFLENRCARCANAAFGPRSALPSIEAHHRGPTTDHSEFARRRVADIYDASAAIGTAVVDAHDHRSTVANVGDEHLCSERQCTMRRGQTVWAGH